MRHLSISCNIEFPSAIRLCLCGVVCRYRPIGASRSAAGIGYSRLSNFGVGSIAAINQATTADTLHSKVSGNSPWIARGYEIEEIDCGEGLKKVSRSDMSRAPLFVFVTDTACWACITSDGILFELGACMFPRCWKDLRKEEKEEGLKAA